MDADGKLYFVLNLPALNGLSDMEVLVANPENGAAQKLARISGSQLSSWLLTQPVLSPDGKWLAVLLADGPTTHIWAQPTSGAPMRRITDFGHQAIFIAQGFMVLGCALDLCRSGKRRADIVL